MNIFIAFPSIKLIRDLARLRGLKIYFVGGFLRDVSLGRCSGNSVIDFDFAIEKDAIAFGREFARKIRGAFVLLDAKNGCSRVVKNEGGRSFVFDFADFRAKTLRADLAHRDFTINTLCLDLKDIDEGTTLPGGCFAFPQTPRAKQPPAPAPSTPSRAHPTTDLLKRLRPNLQAQKDLKSKTIRVVSAKAFQEDPLRLLRAFSLCSSLGFKIESKTLAQIKKDRMLLKDVSPERIRDEFFKILASNRTAETFKAMDKIHLLEEVIPQIRVMFGVVQGGYHHLDVWPHSVETVRQLEMIFEKDIVNNPNFAELNDYLSERLSGVRLRRDILKLAALLHDIGKPDTQKQEKDRMSFHGHEHVGAAIVRSIARMLKVSVRERHMLDDMVRWHLRPGYLSNFKKPSERSIFRYFRDAKTEAVSILLLSLADQRSTRGPMTTEADQRHHEAIIWNLTQRYFESKRQKPLIRLITGHDLIKDLNLKPSPLFAKILKEVEEQQALGKISSKEEALELARKISWKDTK